MFTSGTKKITRRSRDLKKNVFDSFEVFKDRCTSWGNKLLGAMSNHFVFKFDTTKISRCNWPRAIKGLKR